MVTLKATFMALVADWTTLPQKRKLLKSSRRDTNYQDLGRGRLEEEEKQFLIWGHAL